MTERYSSFYQVIMEEKFCARMGLRLADVNIVNNLNILPLATIKSNTSVRRPPEILMDMHNPCLILKGNEKKEYNYIITPWDIVVKTLKSDHIIGGSATH